jgi:hypothetical protein
MATAIVLCSVIDLFFKKAVSAELVVPSGASVVSLKFASQISCHPERILARFAPK